ncbi:MAG: hypothetical protein HQ558_02875 [Candidatus Omnitrophica bacterium]|nr:hypothetical protein [Candidatus Omnitrophota bacterium]
MRYQTIAYMIILCIYAGAADCSSLSFLGIVGKETLRPAATANAEGAKPTSAGREQSGPGKPKRVKQSPITPEDREIWIRSICEVIDFPDLGATYHTTQSYVSFGRFGHKERNEPHYRSAVLDAPFIKAYDSQPPEDRYVEDPGGRKYDRGLKVELPGGFIARFIDFKDPAELTRVVKSYFGIVIHRGNREVARTTLYRPWKGDRDTGEGLRADYEMVWTHVNEKDRGQGIANVLRRVIIALAQKDPYAGTITTVPDHPAIVVDSWDLGFQWKLGQTPQTVDRQRFRRRDRTYTRMADSIIERARLESDPEARRRIYQHLCNGESDKKLGIVNEDGIRFAGERNRPTSPEHIVSDGRLCREISITAEEAIRERDRLIGKAASPGKAAAHPRAERRTELSILSSA